jgi:hypothetical protein
VNARAYGALQLAATETMRVPMGHHCEIFTGFHTMPLEAAEKIIAGMKQAITHAGP